LNCAGETFAATDLCAGHVVASRRGRRMIHSPIGTTRPIAFVQPDEVGGRD
jgi:hypothetical protein